MKIVCRKGNDIKKMIERIRQILEPECVDYPILKEDMVFEVFLEEETGKECPQNEEVIYLGKEDLQNEKVEISALEYYYAYDSMTKLYNRGKYERDISRLQESGTDGFICVYADAVGLHEINNHIGHAQGDQMLCSIADGIRELFPQGKAYRIGGDEFVIFCRGQKETRIRKAITELKTLLRQEEYEISVGMATGGTNLTVMEVINRAEHEMRYDKEQFYHNDGAKRQMRGLNKKLEKILLEKQDASQFLNVIASEYKGVYMVNPNQDTCRHIYIPDYFAEILEENKGVFSKSICMYFERFVCEEEREQFETVIDYNYVLAQIREGKQVGFTYRKKDGTKVHLQITIYNENKSGTSEMLWIFTAIDRI